MKPLRIYVDTSVIGGGFDEEFAADSLRLMDAAKYRRVVLLVSEVVGRELLPGPAKVVGVLGRLPPDAVETVPISTDVLTLRNAYLAAGIVTRRWMDDATHVAAATVARADAIVSWNFRHIVRLDRIKAYNQVNVLHGYGVLTIVSPREVHLDEPDEGQEAI